MITYIVLAILILLLFLAIYWESKDFTRIFNRKPLYTIKNRKERTQEYRFYGLFNSENNIMWRSLYVSAVIAVLLIAYYFNQVSPDVSLKLGTYITIFIIIFMVYYLSHHYRVFHLYRVMGGKFRKKTIL